MDTQNNKATIQLFARIAEDGQSELIADVRGGYIFRDKIKNQGFQFIKNQSAGLGRDAPLDRNGNRRQNSVWRRLLAVLNPDASGDTAIASLRQGIEEMEDMKASLFQGCRIKGAAQSLSVLNRNFKEVDGFAALAKRLEHLDTGWIPESKESTEEEVLTPGE